LTGRPQSGPRAPGRLEDLIEVWTLLEDEADRHRVR
jgi:hypothetical protein